MAAANKNYYLLKHFQAELDAPSARKRLSPQQLKKLCIVHTLHGPIQHLSLKEGVTFSVAELAQALLQRLSEAWDKLCSAEGPVKAGSPADS